MKGAFAAVDRYCRSGGGGSDRADAVDWLSTFDPEQWKRLREVWPARTVAWRAACAELLGAVRCDFEEHALLAQAAFHADERLALAAAESYASHLDEDPNTDWIDPDILKRFSDLVAKHPGHSLSAVKAILSRQ
jgi:hypothetical protein